MRSRIPELLAERQWTAYEMAKRSGGRISLSAAYRLAAGEWKCLSSTVLEALFDVFGLEPGPLFARGDPPRRKNKRA